MRAASRDIPYLRYSELGAGPTLKWVQFTYYFPGRRTIIVRCRWGFDAEGKATPQKGTVWLVSYSTKPDQKDVDPSYFMLDKKPDSKGGNEMRWDP